MAHKRQIEPLGQWFFTLEVASILHGDAQAITVIISDRKTDGTVEHRWAISSGSPTAAQMVDIAAFVEEACYQAIVTHVGVQGVLPT